MLYTFPYFGSKWRSVDKLVALLDDCDVLIEPYGGSAVTAVNWSKGRRWYAFDTDPRIVAIHHWMSTATEAEVAALLDDVEKRLAIGGPFYIAEGNYLPGAAAFAGIAGGTLRGVAGKRVTGVPSRRVLLSLPAWRAGVVRQGDATAAVALAQRAAFAGLRVGCLVDPPYVGTSASYDCRTDGGVAAVVAALAEVAKVVFTYGDNAPEEFPQYNWDILMPSRKMNNGIAGRGSGATTAKATRHDLYTVLQPRAEAS